MYTLLLACLAGILAMIYYASQRRIKPPAKDHSSTPKNAPNAQVIEPLASFDWETTPPKRFRPFKPVYHITMALQSTIPSELITIDEDYFARIEKRRSILSRNPSTVHGCLPEGVSPVRELYSFLLTTYLPTRYPTLFNLRKDTFENTATGSTHPASPPTDPLRALRALAETVEDDLFLVAETPDGHRCVAFVCCFPSGFDPSDKLGKVLAGIHAPVPGYEKIGGSMERFFKKLQAGKSVKRINWFVTTQEDLFNPGNHVHPEPTKGDQNINIETAQVRMELQTLTRLPDTRAILFSFKSYLYPISQIKDEGLGPQLADAIEGLRAGNAPDMWAYKGADRWGESACKYLRT